MDLFKSLRTVGTTGRSARRDRTLSCDQTKTDIPEVCTLHELCDRCCDILSKSELLRNTVSWNSPRVETFTLHPSLSGLVQSVRQRCHMCTLICERLGDSEATREKLTGASSLEDAFRWRSGYRSLVSRVRTPSSPGSSLRPIEMKISLLQGSVVPYVEVTLREANGQTEAETFVISVQIRRVQLSSWPSRG